jgi:hypothetical protein
MNDKNPFEELDSNTITELLVGIKKNFSTFKVGNVVREDNSKHFPLYNELLKYVSINHSKLNAIHRFNLNATYGDMIVRMLNDYGTKKVLSGQGKVH